jgi:hypothetical protein
MPKPKTTTPTPAPRKKNGPKPGAPNAGRPKGEPTTRIGFLLPESLEPHLTEGMRLHGAQTRAILIALQVAYPVAPVASGIIGP